MRVMTIEVSNDNGRSFHHEVLVSAGAGSTLRSVNFIVSSTGRLVLERAFDRRTGEKRIGARSELVRLARVIAANAARALPSLKGAKTRTVVG